MAVMRQESKYPFRANLYCNRKILKIRSTCRIEIRRPKKVDVFIRASLHWTSMKYALRQRLSLFSVYGLLALAGIGLMLWSWQKWASVWIETGEHFFPPEWRGEDLKMQAWQYPIYRSNDSYQWVHLADELENGNRLPLRHRFDEGLPTGRPNRWHSGLAYILWKVGALVSAFHDWPVERGIHQAAHWLGSIFYLSALFGGACLIGRLVDHRAALFFAGLYFFNAAIAWDFAFSRLDHESLFQLCTLFYLIGIAGMIRIGRASATPWALLAGISAGLGWWISATMTAILSMLVTLGLWVECLRRRRRHRLNDSLAAGLKVWSISGMAVTLLFCFFEGRNWPEPSIATLHPLFIFVQMGSLLLCLAVWQKNRIRVGMISMIALFCGLSPLIWMGIYGADAHPWLDPMMRRMHDYIIEFQSPFGNHLRMQPETLQAVASCLLVFAAFIRSRCTTGAVWIPLIAGLFALALFQARWLGLAAAASSLWLCLHPVRIRSNPIRYLSLGLLFLSASTWIYKWIVIEERPGKLFLADMMLQVGARDLNLNLQRLSRGKRVYVAMPYAFAPASALFDEVHPIGTFYWENAPGIQATSGFFAGSKSDLSADFVVVQGGMQGAPFAKMISWISQSDITRSGIESTLAWKLSAEENPPGWVEIPFYGSFEKQHFWIRIYRPDTDSKKE